MRVTETVPQHGPALRALRIKEGLGLALLAGQVGITASHLSNIEAERRGASSGVLHRIARVLRVPVAAIIRDRAAAPDGVAAVREVA